MTDKKPTIAEEPEIGVIKQRKKYNWSKLVHALFWPVLFGLFLTGVVVMAYWSDASHWEQWSAQCVSIGGIPSEVNNTDICVMSDGTFISER